MERLPEELGVVAGGGILPQKLLDFCDAKGIKTFTVAFEHQTDPAILEGRDHVVTRLGAAGEIVKILREKEYTHLVLIGSIKRPHLMDLRPDLYTATFFAKLGLRLLGDDGLLKAVRETLEKEGFMLHGIHELMNDLLMPEGVIGKISPSKNHLADVCEGFKLAKAVGALDIGQSVVVQDGVVLGVEGVEGTDELLRRCASYRQAKAGGILVKTCKPQQDRKLDMPTIGPDTVSLCTTLGYSGIATEAEATLVTDLARVIETADKAGLFVMGVKE